MSNLQNFQLEDKPFDLKQFIIFMVVAAVTVTVLIILNRRSSGKGSGSSGGGGFSGFALRRAARSIGLTGEQTRMLDFVFRTDAVADLDRSLGSSALLDRHFRRAYRVIENNTDSEQETQNQLAVLFSTRNRLENASFGHLTTTRQLRDDSYIVVPVNKERHSLEVLSSTNDYLAVECPQNALGSLIKLPKGNKVSAVAFTKNNKGFAFESRITGYSTVHGKSAMLLAHSNQLKFLSQRRFRRRQAVIACNIYLVYVEGKGKKQRLVVDKRRLIGNIADISVGGCSIKTKAPIQVGSRMKIEFAQGDNTVAALGQVLRSNRAGVATVIHIKFLRVTRKSMNIINAFVYEFIND
jgi:c-di-GMP-binding flagellar brake protein YcgR